eukprot:m.44352 g.44352  ORF g.44352 m.44352 type:complete len:604 (-) comp5824_c0_seq2:153-1964(-)
MSTKSLSATKRADAPESFWGETGYKRVVKRIEDNTANLDLFAKMVTERAELERKHAASMQEWARRWEGKLEKAPTFKEGTLEAAMHAVVGEAESAASALGQLDVALRAEIAEATTRWRKDHYPKGLLGGNKTAGKASDKFEKARKPYAKALDEEKKAKAAYFAASQTVYDLEQRLERAKQYQTATTKDDVAKLQGELDKARPNAAKAKSAYEAKLQKRGGVTQQYRMDMAAAFQSCQEIEKARIEFLVQMLARYQTVIVEGHAQKVQASQQALSQSIKNVTVVGDLQLYSAKFGSDMPFDQKADFEEWSPEKTNAPAAAAASGTLAASGSLLGSWFLKMADKHGRAHRRFFVIDERTKEIVFYEKMVRGVPEIPKGTIKIAEVQAVEVKDKVFVIVTATRRWTLTVAPKDEKSFPAGPAAHVDQWGQTIARLAGIHVTRPAGDPIAAVGEHHDDDESLGPETALRPVRFVASHRTASSVGLTWRAPKETHPIVRYDLTQEGVSAPLLSANMLQFEASGLKPGTMHVFHLRTITDVGVSEQTTVRVKTLPPGSEPQIMDIRPDMSQYSPVHHVAATTIQAHTRGFLARKEVAHMRTVARENSEV